MQSPLHRARVGSISSVACCGPSNTSFPRFGQGVGEAWSLASCAFGQCALLPVACEPGYHRESFCERVVRVGRSYAERAAQRQSRDLEATRKSHESFGAPEGFDVGQSWNLILNLGLRGMHQVMKEVGLD